jgi:hypothetical protein
LSGPEKCGSGAREHWKIPCHESSSMVWGARGGVPEG